MEYDIAEFMTLDHGAEAAGMEEEAWGFLGVVVVWTGRHAELEAEGQSGGISELLAESSSCYIETGGTSGESNELKLYQ